jgi:tRNA-specific adenosine deaminase 2
MCAAALGSVGIGRVVFGCRNDKFGGCGTVLNVHDGSLAVATDAVNASPAQSAQPAPGTFPVVPEVMATEAIALLKNFYARENDKKAVFLAETTT